MNTPKSEDARVSSTAYIWTVPGKPITIHLEWPVIDRLLPEIMRGFGSVPRRGAEVGGILLGRAEAGQPLTVHVTGFQPVRCEHEQGPSFILSAGDREHWLEAFERTRFAPGRQQYAVGYYRSHTREGLSLAPEDLMIMAEFFPAPHDIALLVKPFASRNSEAGFFIYEDGSIRADASYLEFPFRSRAAAKPQPEPVPERNERPLFAEIRPQIADDPPAEAPAPLEAARPIVEAARPVEMRERQNPRSDSEAQFPVFPEDSLVRPGRRKRWNWIFSFVALILLAAAVFVMFDYLTGGQNGWLRMRNPYALGLTFTTASDNLHFSWNREAPVIRSASRGILTITDGGTTRRVDLGRGQLQSGSVVYRRMSNNVIVRLEVFASERNSVAEILELQLSAEPMPAPPAQQTPAPPSPQP